MDFPREGIPFLGGMVFSAGFVCFFGGVEGFMIGIFHHGTGEAKKIIAQMVCFL